jgi:hypothetical protein
MTGWADWFIGLIIGSYSLLLFSLMISVVLLVTGCSRHYEREQPRSQMCKDLGKWDCK